VFGWHLFWPLHWLGLGALGIVGGFFRLAVIAGIVIAVVMIVQHSSRSSGSAGSTGGARRDDSALETLRRRYASGDISKEEYEQKLKDLG
jgi:uncharacterized membrane protein